MRSKFLPFHVPDIGDAEIGAVVDTLRGGWLTTGLRVRQFEEDFSRYIGVAHAVALNSATAALHLALEAIGLREGEEVVLPTLTFASTAEVVSYFRAKPILVDSEPGTLNIDVDLLEDAITPRCRAIIPVHYAGHPCEMGRILEVARSRDLRVIEDAAHALPAEIDGRRIGTIGDITCFSFYATKTITTGEGGMATTASAEWAERMKIMSLHGISRDAWKRYSSEGSWYYEVMAPGFKYNLTDIAASIGIEQLRKIEALWLARHRIADLYSKALSGLKGIMLPSPAPGIRHAWHLYVVQLDLEALRISRNQFIEMMKEERIGTSVHFIPLHMHPYYRDHFGYKPSDFPVSSAASERIVSLPIYPRMTDADVWDVVESVRKSLTRNYR